MDNVPTIEGLGILFTRVVSVILALGGVILFFLIVTAGFRFITSGGDPKGVEVAKKTLTYAIGGFVLILLSYVVLVIIENVAGLSSGTLTDFRIILPGNLSKPFGGR